MKPTAKSLILDLLSAKEGPAPVSGLVVACGLFGISGNSVRVAIARLAAAGSIRAAGRGSYELGERAKGLAREVAAWRFAEKRLRAWNGAYVAVHLAKPKLADRDSRGRSARALRILGLRELDAGLYLRPDNLEGGVDAVRERLHALGLPREAIIFVAGELDREREAKARELWDGKALTASYKKTRATLEAWLARSQRLEPDAAAREAFLLGGAAIRQIIYDPLLPAPLVDVAERRAFVEVVHRFDRAGRVIWSRFFGFQLGSAALSTVQLASGAVH